ncbi:hypothetical protein P9112_002549 [Eukaryota sp. TZLM1-RC]
MSEGDVKTFTCEECSTTFTKPKGRGRPPTKCPECAAKKAEKTESSQTEPRTIVCENCEKEFVHTKRGKAPKKCPECRDEPIAPKVLVCEKCSTEFTSGRGRASKFCSGCRTKPSAEPAKKRTRGEVASETDEIQRQLDEVTATRDKLRSQFDKLTAENKQLQAEHSVWNQLLEKLKETHPDAHDFLVEEKKKLEAEAMEQ